MNKSDDKPIALSNTERLNLSLAALARGDMAELNALQEGCPREICCLPDLDYLIRFQAAIFCAMTFLQECMLPYSKVELSEACLSGFAIAATHPDHRHKVKSSDLKALQDNNAQHLIQLNATYTGFKQACIALALDFDDVLLFLEFESKCPNMDAYLFQSKDAPLKQIERVKEDFIKIFNTYCSNIHSQNYH